MHPTYDKLAIQSVDIVGNASFAWTFFLRNGLTYVEHKVNIGRLKYPPPFLTKDLYLSFDPHQECGESEA